MNSNKECIGNQLLINDRLVSCVSIDQIPFREGVAIYEIFRVVDGVPVFLEDHLDRLYHSLELENLFIREGCGEIESRILRLIATNPFSTGKIKLIASFSKESREGAYDLILYYVPFHPPHPVQYKEGVKVVLCTALRHDPNVKILNTPARERADKRIRETGAYEAVLVDGQGWVREGSRSNLFFVTAGKLITPPDDDVLQGIARKNILRICREKQVDTEIRKIHKTGLRDFDSAFLSGTTPQVLPIRTIEDISYRVENEVVAFLMKAYQNAVDDYIRKKT
jgi:branched-chain amino acid aminotransferase